MTDYNFKFIGRKLLCGPFALAQREGKTIEFEDVSTLPEGSTLEMLIAAWNWAKEKGYEVYPESSSELK
jgi:hypothetical protein